MAYVKVGSSRSASATLTYGEYKDGQKREGVTISSVNCTAGLAKTEFKAIREAYGKTDGVQIHTIVQSFEAGTDPKLVNRCGAELAQRIAPNHQAVIYTHTDGEGGKPHNHIMINAVSLDGGEKLRSSKFLYKARDLSNEISLEHGLPIIEQERNPAKIRYTQAEQAIIKRKDSTVSWKDNIRTAIDDVVKRSESFESFKETLERDFGIKVQENAPTAKNRLTYIDRDGHKARSTRLGADYELKGVQHEFEQTKARNAVNRAVSDSRYSNNDRTPSDRDREAAERERATTDRARAVSDARRERAEVEARERQLAELALKRAKEQKQSRAKSRSPGTRIESSKRKVSEQSFSRGR